MYSFLKTAIVMLIVSMVQLFITSLSYAGDSTNYNLGREATLEEISSWHTDVRPDGHGLPVGVGAVSEGRVIYNAKCASCHGLTGEGVAKFPALRGGESSLKSSKPIKTIGSYWAYATTLWDYINRSMPFGNARSLHENEIYAVTAYILHLNGLLANDAYLDRASLIKTTMPNKDSFYIDGSVTELDIESGVCMSDCIGKPRIISTASPR